MFEGLSAGIIIKVADNVYIKMGPNDLYKIMSWTGKWN